MYLKNYFSKRRIWKDFGPIVSADTIDAEYHTALFYMIDHLLQFLHSFFQAEKKLSNPFEDSYVSG